MKKNAKVASAVGTLLLVVAAWFGISLYSNIPDSPELALKAFYERDVAEDQIMDPLILGGPDVVPLLEKELTNPGMPKRRYAIAALGNLNSTRALPILESVARNASEIDYIRCDALAAIAMIDSEQALQVAKGISGEAQECSSEIAQALEHNNAEWLESRAPRRTYLQALLGRHN